MTTTPTEPLDSVVHLFSVLAHPGRLRVLLLLEEKGRLSAGELAELVGMEQSAMSHQLRLLRDGRLVIAHREGRRVMYGIADHHVSHIVGDAMRHVAE